MELAPLSMPASLVATTVMRGFDKNGDWRISLKPTPDYVIGGKPMPETVLKFGSMTGIKGAVDAFRAIDNMGNRDSFVTTPEVERFVGLFSTGKDAAGAPVLDAKAVVRLMNIFTLKPYNA
jgi:hypothetical protein